MLYVSYYIVGYKLLYIYCLQAHYSCCDGRLLLRLILHYWLLFMLFFVYTANYSLYSLGHYWWMSMKHLKWECWYAIPQWIKISSLKNDVDGAALREYHQPFLFTESSSQALCAVSQVECWHCCFFMGTGQLHSCHTVLQHAVTKWQCWWCCSDAELIRSSSCTCSIFIPDRRNVIVLSPT